MIPPPPLITLFPYTTLFRSEMFERDVQPALDAYLAGRLSEKDFRAQSRPWGNYDTAYRPLIERAKAEDRKSTRLNSSHVEISYAVFCLKKKTTISETFELLR